MILPIATALAVGVYVVLSRDVQPERPESTTGESFQYTADDLLDREGHPELSAIHD